jgi:hypothetical protein
MWLALTFLLLASLPTFSQNASDSQPEGTISGMVLDDHGQPFKGAQVCTYGSPAGRSGANMARGKCRLAATTDELGQFRIDHVAMGTFGVEPITPDEDYIDFGLDPAGYYFGEIVTVTPNQSATTIVLKLGPKAGKLLLSVTDKVTGQPIVGDYGLSWTIFPGPPSKVITGREIVREGERIVRVPSGKYLDVTISTLDYKPWHYQDPSDPSRPAFIYLQAGEDKELLVELEPQGTP